MVKLTDLPLPVHLHGINLELEDSCSLLVKITVAGSEECKDSHLKGFSTVYTKPILTTFAK